MEYRIISSEKCPCDSKGVIWVHHRNGSLVAEMRDKQQWKDIINNNDIQLIFFEYTGDSGIKCNVTYDELVTIIEKQHKYPIALFISPSNDLVLGTLLFQKRSKDSDGVTYCFSGMEEYNTISNNISKAFITFNKTGIQFYAVTINAEK